MEKMLITRIAEYITAEGGNFFRTYPDFWHLSDLEVFSSHFQVARRRRHRRRRRRRRLKTLVALR